MARDPELLKTYFERLDDGFVRWEDLTHVKELGKGQFAQVGQYRVHGGKGGDKPLVAVKRLKSEALRGRDMADFTAEAAIMRSLSHPNIVRFRGAGIWCATVTDSGIPRR
eukprot:scaffold1108_cov387-Prasinococcus_capsulatus_cf.AAC.13